MFASVPPQKDREALDKACFIQRESMARPDSGCGDGSGDEPKRRLWNSGAGLCGRECQSTKVVKIIQSYTGGVVNKMVWRK